MESQAQKLFPDLMELNVKIERESLVVGQVLEMILRGNFIGSYTNHGIFRSPIVLVERYFV